MNQTFPVYNLTCESCSEVIRRTVAKFSGASLKSVDFTHGSVVVDCNESELEPIRKAVYARGYGPEHQNKKTARHVLSGVLGSDSAFAAERKILEYTLGSFVLVFVFSLALAFMFVHGGPSFWSVTVPLLFLLSLGTAATIAAVAHLSFFKTYMGGMTGMMVGMTVGMSSGFMFGALVGATNGMFVGSLAGMAVGMGLGAWAGRCCGIMGVMEGLMAGLMSGTMGAMLSVMMLREPVMLFLVILFLCSIAILAGLSFAVFKEAGTIPQESFSASFFEYAVAAVILGVLFTFLMLAGPKSAVVIGV